MAFETSIGCCHRIFGRNVFRKPSAEGGARKPISKSVFDSLSVNVAWLSGEQRQKLEERKGEFQAEFFHLFSDNEFLASITNSTAHKSRVTKRFECVREVIKRVIEHD